MITNKYSNNDADYIYFELIIGNRWFNNFINISLLVIGKRMVSVFTGGGSGN